MNEELMREITYESLKDKPDDEIIQYKKKFEKHCSLKVSVFWH